jgi:hypothetical protein
MSAVLQDSEKPFEIVPVWKQVTSELAEELVALWARDGAIPDAARAVARANQAVCIARDAEGTICGVGTAVIRVLPRLRQPMYYYRQYFAPEFRGHKQAIPFLNRARQVLRDYNATLDKPESLGVLLELENPILAKHYTRAYEPAADSTFIGYSPRGLQLRVSYFDDARLVPPVPLARGERLSDEVPRHVVPRNGSSRAG